MEEVIISIELEKGDNEVEVDALTKKIVGLTKANKDLTASNKALSKAGQENSEEYIENTRQLEINKQKISEANASRKNLVKTIISEDDSIKSLKIRNAELIKQRDQISLKTAEGRQRISELNDEIDKNNKTIGDNSSAMEKQRMNIGNYKSALDAVVPGLGRFIDGVEGATKAGLTFIATPIGLVLGAIALALGAVATYFKRTEEGGDKLNVIIFTMEALFGKLLDVVSFVGETLVEAFENPKKAIEDLGNFLRDNLINRIEGFFELIPRLSQAISLLFSGDLAKAGEVALDAVAKVGLGVENATEKIGDFINEVGKAVDEAIKQGQLLGKLDKLLGDQEEALIVDRAKTALEVARIREQALKLEGDARKKKIQEAIALEKELSDAEVAFANTKLKIALEEQKRDGVTGETKKRVAEAEAEVINALASRYQATLRFNKEIASLDAEALREKERLAAEERKIAEETFKFYQELQKETFDRNQTELENQQTERLTKLKEGYLNELVSKEEFDAQFAALEVTALEEQRAFLLENGLETVAIDAQITDAKIKNKEREVAAINAAENRRLENERALTLARIGLGQQLAGLVGQLAGKNKEIASGAVIFEKAAAIAQIVANTSIANAKAIAASPLTFGQPWVGINTASGIIAGISVAAEAAKSISEIHAVKAKRGALLSNFGIAQTGGVLVGPSHARGGIPFTVGGQVGFEAEGGEAVINERSTKMFRRELSAINVAGGGVPFGRGGVPRTYQTGSIIASTSTRSAFQQAETRSQIRDTVAAFMQNMPAIVVTVEDINAKTEEVDSTIQRAQVI